jgi:hypothetical protein
MRQKLLIGLIATVGVTFILGFMASRDVFGAHGWAIALILGAVICAGVVVALAPLRPHHSRRDSHQLHPLRRY